MKVILVTAILCFASARSWHLDGPQSGPLSDQLADDTSNNNTTTSLELSPTSSTDALSDDGLSRLTPIAGLRATPRNQKQVATTTTNITTSSTRHKGANESRTKLDKAKNLTTDCIAKRNAILRHLQSNQRPSGPKEQSSPSSGLFQKLKPRYDETHSSSSSSSSSSSTSSMIVGLPLNDTSGLDEHIPKCTPSGAFEPVQCHKIGYCWCVNKYGQAIKNTAEEKEMPHCDSAMYENEGNDFSVVTGVSKRNKGMIKPSGPTGSSGQSYISTGSRVTGPTTLSEDDSDSDSGAKDKPSSSTQDTGSKDNENESFDRRVHKSQEPMLALVPSECAMSRAHAEDKAARYPDDNIWIPECDPSDVHLYADRQCHKVKVCWCVDQVTGLPLRTSEQLGRQANGVNCTRLTLEASKAKKNFINYETAANFYAGFSDMCDSTRRAEFVQFLMNQFRLQLADYVKFEQRPHDELLSASINKMSDKEVSKWKFNVMDSDSDQRLGDREWNKFMSNFKLADKFEKINLGADSSTINGKPLQTLIILRDQRRCWRDFLQFCGDFLTDEALTLNKWLNCTELPANLSSVLNSNTNKEIGKILGEMGVGEVFPMTGSKVLHENSYSNSKEAAVNRIKQKKNPFLGILKSD